MSWLTRDGTAKLVSRDRILRRERGREKFIFPVQLTTSRIGNLTGLIHTLLYVMTILYIRPHFRQSRGLMSMNQQNRTAHMAWVGHIINSYTRRDKLSHEDGSVLKILKI